MTRGHVPIRYILSGLSLAVLIAFGIAAWTNPTVRDRPLRVPPGDEWELLDFGMTAGKGLPLTWSSKGTSRRTINSPAIVGKQVTWHNAFLGEPSVYVSQEMRKYQTETAAIIAYTERTKKVFDRGPNNEVAWFTPDDLVGPTFADKAMLQCLGDETDFSGYRTLRRTMPAASILLPRRHCVVIARYAALVVELHASIFHRRWITLKRFQIAIHEMDRGVTRATLWWHELYEAR